MGSGLCGSITAQVKAALLFNRSTAILIVLWLLGFVSSYTMGGLIHILLIVALIVVVVGFLQGRRG